MKIQITYKDVELDIEFSVVPFDKESGRPAHIGWMNIKIEGQDVTDLLEQHSEEIETLILNTI